MKASTGWMIAGTTLMSLFVMTQPARSQSETTEPGPESWGQPQETQETVKPSRRTAGGAEPSPQTRQAISELPAGRWSAGSSMGFLGSTPDGTAFGMNGNAEYFVSENVSIGPLMQLGFTDDMTLLGVSGQGKYYIGMPGTQGRGRLVLQSGLGFAHADFLRDDTSWLVPLGLGYDYTLDSGVSLTATGLVNFTDLHTGAGTSADVMPGFAFGVRF